MDKLKITILQDGTIRTESDQISVQNHSNAEEFLSHMASLAGGTTERTNRGAESTTHSHTHDETHQH